MNKMLYSEDTALYWIFGVTMVWAVEQKRAQNQMLPGMLTYNMIFSEFTSGNQSYKKCMH